MNFSFFKQLDCIDCGLSYLSMIAKFYGENFTLQALSLKAFISKSGVSMIDVNYVAESIDFLIGGYRLTWEQLHHEDQVSCIVDFNRMLFMRGTWIWTSWMQARCKVSETLSIIEADDISKDVNNENLVLYLSCNVIGTPTFFINGYLLPSQYGIDDIKYFKEVFHKKKILLL